MNHPHRLQSPGPSCLTLRRPLAFALALLVSASVFAPSTAFGQRGESLPKDLKTATNAKPRQAEIEKFVSGQVARLQKGKATDQKKARDLLVKESGAAGVTPSPSYLEVYSTVVNKQLKTLSKSQDPRTRLNAAIALQRVASKTNNGVLAETAATFAADPCAGVSLWGTKASQNILPSLARAGKNTNLTGAIVEGVRKHPDQPELLEEAYRALTLELRANPQNVNPQAVPVLLPDVLKLFELRVKQYVTTTPTAPLLDERAAIFLTASRVWTHPEARKHHAAIMQQLSDLVSLATQHAAARDGNAAREPFTNLVRRLGEALTVVAGPQGLKDANLQAAAKSLTEVSPGMDNEVLSDRAEAAFEAIKARFPDVKASPQIEETAVSDEEPVDEPAAPAEDAVPAAAGDEAEDAPEAPADEDAEQ
jgi:hypothetical protein